MVYAHCLDSDKLKLQWECIVLLRLQHIELLKDPLVLMLTSKYECPEWDTPGWLGSVVANKPDGSRLVGV